MKKLLLRTLPLLLIFCLLCPMNAIADTGGSGNIDGGGGGMGQGTSTNSWNSGNEGVRVTIAEHEGSVRLMRALDMFRDQLREE